MAKTKEETTTFSSRLPLAKEEGRKKLHPLCFCHSFFLLFAYGKLPFGDEKNNVIMSPKGKLSPSGKVIVLLLFSFFLPKEEIKRR
jgi:hypothetical protein